MQLFFCLVALSQEKVKFTKQVRLSRLAMANGLIYTPIARGVLNHTASIFPSDLPGETTGVIAATPSARPWFEIGHHSYSIGHTNRIGYYWDYICIQLDRTFLHIILDSKKNILSLFNEEIASSQPYNLSSGQQAHLAVEFNRYFTLYGPSGNEADALYIFTPELMTLLINEATDYDAEVVNDRVYFFRRTNQVETLRPYDPLFFDRAFKIIETIGRGKS